MAGNEGIAKRDISVAILTRNPGGLFRRVLEGIRAQETDRDVEIVAIDSGSTDGTLELLDEFGAKVLRIAPDDFDFGHTRDVAYQQARGDIVVNLSQDAVPAHTNWLKNLIAPLEDEAVGVSCGASKPDDERDIEQFPWERNGYFYFTREFRNFVKRYGKGVSFANSAVPRKVWESLRFDPQPLAEDFQFQIKLHDAGMKTAFPQGAEVLHHHNYDLGGLYGRCRNEGLALRMMGSPYGEWDLVRDLLSYRKYLQWLRELRRGDLASSAAILFPVVRPFAVYVGSRFGKEYRAYEHRMGEASREQ